MNVLRHLLGFVLCLGIGIGGFIFFKNASDRGVNAAVEEQDSAGEQPSQQTTTQNREEPTDKALDQATPVTVMPVSRQTLSPELTLYGAVESPRQSDLSAAVSADVLAVEVFEGSQVEAGSIIIRLDSNDLDLIVAQRRADVAEIKANIQSQQRTHQANLEALGKEQELLELYRRALARAEKLASSRVGSEASIDDALRLVRQQELNLTSRQRGIDEHTTATAVLDARLARAEATLKKAERDVGRALMTAPYNGRVIEVNVSPGDRVQVGEKLLSMYDTRYVEARAQLPSRYVQMFQQSLKNGSNIIAQGQIEGQSHELVIDRLGGRIKSGSGSLDALFRFSGDTPPQLGRTISMRVQLPAVSNVIALPNTAIRSGDRVYRVIENTLQTVPVKRLGEFRSENGESQTIVESNEVTSTDRIIISQLTNPVDGMRVLVRD